MDYYFPQHRCAHLLSSFPSGILLVWLLLIALSLPIQGRGNDMKNADLYTLLGISRAAEHREVVSRFRSLARSLHPDALPAHTTPAQREKARQHFLAISEAYEVLSNPKKRARYDQNFRHFKETPRDREYLQYHLFDAGFEAGVVFSTVELQEMYNRQKMHEESVNESSSYTTTFAILFWSTRVADCVNAGITWKEAAKRMQGVSSVVFGAYQCDQNNSACNGLPIRRVPTVLLFRGAKIIPYLGDTIETQQILEKLSPYVQLPSDGRGTIVHHLGESEHTYFLDVCPFNETGRVSLAMYRSTLIVTHHLPFVSFEYNLCYDCSLETKLALSSIISAFPSIRHDRVLCRSEEEMGGAESEDLDDEVDPLDFPRVCREYGMWQQDHAWTIVALHLNSYFSLIPFTRTERRTFDGKKKKKKNSNQRSPTNPLTFSSLHTRSGINVIPYPQKERHRAESYRRFILRNLPLSLRSAIESAKSQPWVAKEVKLQSVEAYIEISMRPSEYSGNSNRSDLADTMGLDSLAYLNLLRLVRDSTIPHMATYSRNRAEARIFLTLPNVHPSRWKSSALPQIRIFPFGTKAKAQDPIVVPHRLLSSTYSKLCTYLSQEVEPLRLYQLGPEFSQKVFPESLGDVVKTQKQTRASSRAWFVLFNAGSWCPPCERVRPIWRDFARSMQGRKPRDGGNIRIALVNCDVHVSVCEEQGIDGFPTIIFYQGRSIKRIFDGSKNDVPSLVSFALSSWNNFVRDTTVQELRNRVESRDPRNATMQSTPYLVSFTGGSWCPPCVQMNATFKLLAQRISQSAQNVLVGQVDCDENQFICNRFDVEGVPTIVLFHPQPDVVMVRMPATPDRSINAVVQFLQEHIPDFKLRKSR